MSLQATISRILILLSGGTGGIFQALDATLQANTTYFRLGRTGFEVSEIGLGTRGIGGHLWLGGALKSRRTGGPCEAIDTARRLVCEEGSLCGISSGVAMTAALRLPRNSEFRGKMIVVTGRPEPTSASTQNLTPNPLPVMARQNGSCTFRH